MNLSEFAKALKVETGLPLAYHHFKSGQAPPLPYLTYVSKGDDPTFADDENYIDFNEINVELYTDKKDLVSEALVTGFFNAHKIPFLTYETWIDSEQMFEVLYQTTI